MKIRYQEGDLFAATQRVLIHGCNAQGVMGSGVAAAIRARWPAAYDDYRREFETNGLKLGTIIVSETDDRIIVHAITQEDFGRDPDIVYVDYEAVRQCFEAINERFADQGAVALPRIGAGLGNGDWSRLAAIIEAACTTVEPIVYIPIAAT